MPPRPDIDPKPPTLVVAATLGALLAAAPGRSRADAVVTTRAMAASTIAELFVEESLVRIEIEAGARDLLALVNVLPDKAYESLTGRRVPLTERVARFANEDWRLSADGEPLEGKVTRFQVASRVARDEVTGEPLADQQSGAEKVVRVTIEYEMPDRPRSLTIQPPLINGGPAATIGFVGYHLGVPMNDFRYLSPEQTADLDWDDPWYSGFRHRNLRRRFSQPLSVYLYVEPHEVRKEIIVRPKDLQQWVDLGLGDRGIIPADSQEELLRRVADFLGPKNPIQVDGQPVEGRLDRIHFIRRTLRTTGVIDPPIDLDIHSATLGVIFVYPVSELPERVTMRWELFSEKIREVETIASDEAGGLPGRVTPDDPVAEWRNYLTDPTDPGPREIAPPTVKGRVRLPALSIAMFTVALTVLARVVRDHRLGKGFSVSLLGLAIASGLAGTAVLPHGGLLLPSPFASESELDSEASRRLVNDLLYNAYRSFDHHDEGVIYDRLSESIGGELLERVYLETRRSMEVKNQGGLRVSVKQVEIENLEPVDSAGPGAAMRCRWRVSGSIGHWGHLHRRENLHAAILRIDRREGRWKITGMETLDAKAVEPVGEGVSG